MVLLSISSNLAHFGYHKEITAYELDGRQQTFLSICMLNRVTMLDLQWHQAGVKSSFMTVVVGCVALFKIFLPLLRLVEVSFVADSINFLNKNIDKILNHTGAVLNTACLVSYIAMIVSGHFLVGGFGLVGLLMIIFKERGYFPGDLERKLVPFELVNNLIISLISPQLLLLKCFTTLNSIYLIANFLEKNQTTQAYFSRFFKSEPFNDKKMETAPENWRQIIEDGRFEIYYESRKAKELDDIFLPEDKVKIARISVQELYREIEERILSLSLKINEKGWEMIKKALISDSVRDERPINFEIGQDLLKMVLYKISQSDDEKFTADVTEFADIGASCATGWFREMGYLLNPQSKTNISWMVHHHLAEMRGELIKQGIRAMNRQISMGRQGPSSLEDAGGENNVHLVNQVQAVLEHRWRSNAAIIDMQMNGKSIFMKFLQEGEASNVNKTFEYNLKNRINSLKNITSVLPVYPFRFVGTIDRFVKQAYTIDAMYESFHSEWDPIASWLATLEEKGIDILTKTADYDLIVGKNSDGTSYLTKEGFLLLLWDLGIIQPV
jgi:hypothetical protein